MAFERVGKGGDNSKDSFLTSLYIHNNTPHCMERHTSKNNVLETIKVPLQRLSKSGRTTFAYMRRSTTKREQESSLPQQEEGIEQIVKML